MAYGDAGTIEDFSGVELPSVPRHDLSDADVRCLIESTVGTISFLSRGLAGLPTRIPFPVSSFSRKSSLIFSEKRLLFMEKHSWKSSSVSAFPCFSVDQTLVSFSFYRVPKRTLL